MDEQIKIELADMRIAHDRNSINAQSGGLSRPMLEAIVEPESP
jgi:hypothetical protein